MGEEDSQVTVGSSHDSLGQHYVPRVSLWPPPASGALLAQPPEEGATRTHPYCGVNEACEPEGLLFCSTGKAPEPW